MSVRLGDLELTPLHDGFIRLDGGAMCGVVPKPLWQRRAPADDRNRIRLGRRPLLVRGHGRTILIDAGIGAKTDTKNSDIYGVARTPTLEASLAGCGLTPADIDTVIATHLPRVRGLLRARPGDCRRRHPRSRRPADGAANRVDS